MTFPFQTQQHAYYKSRVRSAQTTSQSRSLVTKQPTARETKLLQTRATDDLSSHLNRLTHNAASLTLPGSSSTEHENEKKKGPTHIQKDLQPSCQRTTQVETARISSTMSKRRDPQGLRVKRTHVTDTRDRRNPMGSTWETAESRRREAQQARMGNSQCGMGREKARRVDFLLSDLRVTWG